jgi:hypothetical protein
MSNITNSGHDASSPRRGNHGPSHEAESRPTRRPRRRLIWHFGERCSDREDAAAEETDRLLLQISAANAFI